MGERFLRTRTRSRDFLGASPRLSLTLNYLSQLAKLKQSWGSPQPNFRVGSSRFQALMSLVFRLLLFSLFYLPLCFFYHTIQHLGEYWIMSQKEIFFITTLPIMSLYGKDLMLTSVAETGNFCWYVLHKVFTPFLTKISALWSPDIEPRPLLPTLQSFRCGFLKLHITPRAEWSSLTFSCEHSAILGRLHHAETGAAYCNRTALFDFTKERLRQLGGFVQNGQNIPECGGFSVPGTLH